MAYRSAAAQDLPQSPLQFNKGRAAVCQKQQGGQGQDNRRRQQAARYPQQQPPNLHNPAPILIILPAIVAPDTMPLQGIRKMPPMLLPTRRQWPQTLLLTALALLIAAATIMLACNQSIPPVPAGEDTFSAASPAASGIEDTPAAATEEPTNTPTPYPTLCVTIPEGYQDPTELGENHVRRDGFLYYCFVPPIATPKYPVLGDRPSRSAQAAQAGAAIEIPVVYLRIDLSDNTEEVLSWLQRNGVPLPEDRVEGDRGYIAGYAVDWERGDDFIYAWVPASLLVAISQQEGVIYMEDVGHLLPRIN